MHWIKLLPYVIAAISLLSCTDNSSGPSNDSGFSLRITVKDAQGAPVPNLQVSGGTLVPVGNAENQRVWVNRLFVARIAIRDTSVNALVFQDSIIMALASADPSNALSLLGRTSTLGEIKLSDLNRFPGLLPLPKLPLTQNDPTPLMNFSLGDSIILIIQDPATLLQQTERRVISNRSNIVDVQWSPSPYTPSQKSSSVGATTITFDVVAKARVIITVSDIGGTTVATPIDQQLAPGSHALRWTVPAQGLGKLNVSQVACLYRFLASWKLYPNYPNPFG